MTADHIDRAAEVIAPALRTIWESDASWNPEARDIARALDAADMLVAPEHDAAVAARAWNEGHTAGVRNASVEFDGPLQDNPYSPCAYCGGSGTVMVHERYGNGGGSNSAIACRWCEAGESGADT